MSREERRAYQRMNRGRDPYAPPVSKETQLRMERAKARREAKRRAAPPSTGLAAPWLRWAVIGFFGIGLIALSLAWPNGMPTALYIGLVAGAAWVGLVLLARLVMGRGGPSRGR